MRPMSPEETKSVELKILTDVADFCERHGLRYYLAYGTLIGAVRHKGFIPWDDDIDIQMPREDYVKFLEIFNEENKEGHLRAISPNDPASFYSFTKIIDTRTVKIEAGIKYDNKEHLGIDIDIFPLDGQPDGEKEYIKWYKKKFKIYKLKALVMSDPDLSWKRKLICPLLQAFRSKEYYQKKADKLQTVYPYADSKYVGCTASLFNSPKNRHNKEDFSDSVKVEFEGHLLNAPIGYDKVLRDLFGDYMQLPPIEQQITHHSNKTFWKNDIS